jgi:predicted metalloprotease
VRAHPLAVAATSLALLAGCSVVTGQPADDASSSAPPPGDVVQQSLRDVERFWAAAYPPLADGAAFRPVQGGFHPYTRTDPPPACGEEPAEYQPNAFYCPVGDFIAWDADQLVPQLQQEFGPLLVGVVMAHEYGHAVQTRLKINDQPTVVLEQQADCFAGAWVADARSGRSTAFRDITPEQLDNTVGGLLQLRDQPGTSAVNPQAHGNAFDRVRAFQEGVEQGAARCAAYPAGNLPVTEVPFSSREEAATGGNLPYDTAVTSLSEDAQAYWSRAYPQLAGAAWQPLRVVPFDAAPPDCADADQAASERAFYCPSGSFVAFDNRELAPALYQQIGDNAVGVLIGDLFARAALDRSGRSADGREGQLATDCLAGTWSNDLLTRDEAADIRLSPGDLDEAVTALLAFGRAGGGGGATAFDRIAAYREGVLNGLAGCR